jgi:hypothetical protein
MKIGIPQIVAVVVIIAMVWGLVQLDKQGFFENPIDKIPSVEIGK